MEKGIYKFRKLNPRSGKDLKTFLIFEQRLKDKLKVNAKPLTEEQIKWQKMRLKNGDETAFFCECNGEVVGYINVCNYHVEDGVRYEDNIGIISDIFIDESHGNGANALTLLKLGVKELIKNGKTQAVMMVQEDNKNKFLHFAIADKLIYERVCTRKDGTNTLDYNLLISDLNKIAKLTMKEIMVKVHRMKKKLQEDEMADLFAMVELS